MSDQQRWEEYVRGQLANGHPLAAFDRGWHFHRTLYGQILEIVPPPARILDVGTGTGLNAAWLSMHGYQVTGIDNNPRIIGIARELAERFGLDLTLEVADTFDLSAFHRSADLVLSNGVIEHWDADRAIAALKEQAACAPTVISQIPTPYTVLAHPVTDERFYSPRGLRRLFRAAGLGSVKTFGYGDVRSRRARVAEFALPVVLFRYLHHHHGRWAMAIACVGQVQDDAHGHRREPRESRPGGR